VPSLPWHGANRSDRGVSESGQNRVTAGQGLGEPALAGDGPAPRMVVGRMLRRIDAASNRALFAWVFLPLLVIFLATATWSRP